MVLGLLAVDNFDFTRKIVQKKLGDKTRENVGVLVKIEFLDKNLTFRIVWLQCMKFSFEKKHLYMVNKVQKRSKEKGQ